MGSGRGDGPGEGITLPYIHTAPPTTPYPINPLSCLGGERERRKKQIKTRYRRLEDPLLVRFQGAVAQHREVRVRHREVKYKYTYLCILIKNKQTCLLIILPGPGMEARRRGRGGRGGERVILPPPLSINMAKLNTYTHLAPHNHLATQGDKSCVATWL
jgi:hypothetical protein